MKPLIYSGFVFVQSRRYCLISFNQIYASKPKVMIEYIFVIEVKLEINNMNIEFCYHKLTLLKILNIMTRFWIFINNTFINK